MRKKPLKDIKISDLQKEAIRRDVNKSLVPIVPNEDKLLKSVEGMAGQMVAISQRSDNAMELVLKVLNETSQSLSELGVSKKPKQWKFKVKRTDNRNMTIKAKEIK